MMVMRHAWPRHGPKADAIPQKCYPVKLMLIPQNANSAFLGFTTCKMKPTAPEKLMDPKARENFFLKEIMVCVEWGVSPECQMKKILCGILPVNAGLSPLDHFLKHPSVWADSQISKA